MEIAGGVETPEEEEDDEDEESCSFPFLLPSSFPVSYAVEASFCAGGTASGAFGLEGLITNTGFLLTCVLGAA